MNKTVLGMAIVAVILVIIAFIQGGFSLVGKGFFEGGQTLLILFPIIIIAFVVAGLSSILIPRDMVSTWMGKEAGWKGPFIGALLGALVPGGPFFFYPLMAVLIASGANVGTMISFVAAKTLWNIPRIPVEIAFVGVEITAIRFLLTFAIPILIGGAVNIFLPGFATKIKEDVNKLQAEKESREGVKEID